jgi:PAS domain S-box-containing protein
VLNQVHHHIRPSWWVVAVARPLLLIFVLAPSLAAQSNAPKRVLILLENDISWPAFRLIDENAHATLRAGSPEGISIFSEHLDRANFPDSALQAEQMTWIKQKYANSNLDLIIAVGHIPPGLFSGVPLVFMSDDPLRKRPDSVTPSTGAASVWVSYDAQKTLEVAHRLQPAARRIVVIGDGLRSGDSILTRLRRMLPTTFGDIPITYVTNSAVSEICQGVSKLGPDSIVLYTALTKGEHRHSLIPAEVIPKIAAASGAPVYVLADNFMGTGAVGGYVASFAEVGKAGGQLGLRILAGEHPKDVVVQNVYLFDWRQLRRWKISEAALPSGSLVLYRQPSLWESYRYYILSGILLCLIETLLVLGLLWQRANRRRVQQSLVERMAFEKMLCDLSRTFINLPEEQVGATIQESLGRIAEFLKIGRITLFDYSQESRELTMAFSWCGKGVENPPTVMGINQLPWWSDRLLRGDSVLLSDLNSLPEEAFIERDYLTRMGAVSVATIPLKAGDEFFGCISYVSTKRRVLWTEDLIEQLKLLAEVFSNALMRQRALDARLRHAAIVDSSDDAIVSKNLNGIIVSWNAAAQRLFGYAGAEAVGKPITTLIPNELRDEEDFFHQHLAAGEHVQRYETVRVVKDGTRVAVALTISPVRDSSGNVVGFSEIAHDITDRKRAEHVLRESEERFRLVANSAPVLIWMSGTDKLYTFFNQGWLGFTGRSMEEELGEGWASGVHPDDLHCLEIYSASFDARVDFEMEYRLRRFDGEYRWIIDFGVPRFEADGTFCGFIGSCVDISERKSSEESLQNLSGRLIHAQEEERSRIARDLHDDFSQGLALQCIDLEQLLKKLAKTETDERTRLLKMLKRTKQMTADIRALSHQLHSNKLEYVGLVPAVSGLCKEISEKYEIQVHFTECEFPQDIPKDVALCLFRVAQEGLGNVVKHSQAKNTQVELSANPSGVSLRIADDGMGFAPKDTTRGGGLGLVGMTERLRLVRGRLSVTSELMQGTTILAEVPMSAFPTEGQVRAIAAGGAES